MIGQRSWMLSVLAYFDCYLPCLLQCIFYLRLETKYFSSQDSSVGRAYD